MALRVKKIFFFLTPQQKFRKWMKRNGKEWFLYEGKDGEKASQQMWINLKIPLHRDERTNEIFGLQKLL
jgi:hypothetical protein